MEDSSASSFAGVQSPDSGNQFISINSPNMSDSRQVKRSRLNYDLMQHKIQKTIQGEYNPPSHRDFKKRKF